MKYLLMTGVHRSLAYMNIEVMPLLMRVRVTLGIVHETRKAHVHNSAKQKISWNIDNVVCVLSPVDHIGDPFLKPSRPDPSFGIGGTGTGAGLAGSGSGTGPSPVPNPVLIGFFFNTKCTIYY